MKTTPTWHTEDSPWKANQIIEIICYNHLQPKSIAETGCGTGAIIDELSKKESIIGRQFSGYDIPLQAIEPAEQRASERIRFFREDHEIVDYFYTNAAFRLSKQRPSLKRMIANGPRWLFSRFSR